MKYDWHFTGQTKLIEFILTAIAFMIMTSQIVQRFMESQTVQFIQVKLLNKEENSFVGHRCTYP